MVLITIVTEAYKPTYNLGGAHCIKLLVGGFNHLEKYEGQWEG